MNGYARFMPALGFDPAPGDVASTNALARRYAEIAAEVDQVQAMVTRVPLTQWQGQSGTATRTRVAAILPALTQAADTVRQLSDAATRWAVRLASFQAEADLLERQAAAQIADTQSLTAMQARFASQRGTAASGVQRGGETIPRSLTSDIAQSTSALASIRAQAEQLHEEYLTTAASITTEFNLAAWWDSTEDIRKYPEGILAVLDMMTADHWISWGQKIALVPRQILAEAAGKLFEAESLNASGAPLEERFAALIEAGKAYERAGTGLDAIDAFASPLQKTLQASASGIRFASVGLGALGILGDVNDMLSPQDSGAMGWADRGAAAVNAGFLTADLVGADMVMTAIPGLGEAAIAATGIYLAGDYFYHHWTPFHDVANDVGHATVRAAENVGHDASTAWHTISGWF